MTQKYDKAISRKFYKFCYSVLQNEIKNIRREYQRRQEYETFFADLSIDEQLNAMKSDKYFSDGQSFEVEGKKIIVKNIDIAYALEKLSDKRRNIILLSYFEGMSDVKISAICNVSRSTVLRNRRKALKQLGIILMQEGNYGTKTS